MLMPKRKWKDIEGYEGKYQVSNDGKVRSLNYHRTGQKNILKQGTCRGGYKRARLCKNNKYKNFLVHRLVAQAFIPNVNNSLYVNHKDENKTNNHVNNLEWCTIAYNNSYGTRTQRAAKKRRGQKHTKEAKRKMSEKNKRANNPQARKVQCINNGMIFDCIKDGAEWCGLKGSNSITAQIKSKQKTAGKHPQTGEKLQWKYID